MGAVETNRAVVAFEYIQYAVCFPFAPEYLFCGAQQKPSGAHAYFAGQEVKGG